ncbi:MAG: RNA-binding S4 domain-containing protein [Ruminococcaceae bacterium]|nr:RNA-binding S4 domain-containing protein [Oscillospiraceae bacterium]
MRLDKFLKVSRLIKRRTVANEACDTSRLMVNGKIAKASYTVKIDDIIQISFGERTLKVKVKSILESIHKSDASSMYEVIDD